MKIIFKIIVLVFLFCLLISCGNKKQDNLESTNNNTHQVVKNPIDSTESFNKPDFQRIVYVDVPQSPFNGYFENFEIGDYVHALFKLNDSSVVSLWLPNSVLIEEKLKNSKGKMLKIFYELKTEFLPEAGDSIKIEVIKSIKIIE